MSLKQFLLHFPFNIYKSMINKENRKELILFYNILIRIPHNNLYVYNLVILSTISSISLVILF